jgi:hypothetical protein
MRPEESASPSRPQSAPENRREETSGGTPPPAPRGRRLRAWIIGLMIAALGAALTGIATGEISTGLKSAWKALVGESEPPPLTVSAHVQHTRRSSFFLPRPANALPPLPRDMSVRSRRITEAALRPWMITSTPVVEASTPPLRFAQRTLVASRCGQPPSPRQDWNARPGGGRGWDRGPLL